MVITEFLNVPAVDENDVIDLMKVKDCEGTNCIDKLLYVS